MPTAIDCPFCRRSLNLPEEALSRQVQCPGCGGLFLAARSHSDDPAIPTSIPTSIPKVILEVDEVVSPPIPGVPPPPRGFVPVLVGSDRGPGGLDPEPALERCPRCGARATRAQDRCLSCNNRLRNTDNDRPWEEPGSPLRRDCESHRGPLLLTLGRISLCFAIPGLLGVAFLPFAVASLVGAGLGLTVSLMARDDLEQMRRKEMDPEGEQNTLTGQTCSSIALVLGLVGLVLAGLLRLPFVLGGW
jgi:hypothetical protein